VHQSFRDFVEKALSGRSFIKKLTLKCQDGRISVCLTDKWIRLALERGLVDLDLRLTTALKWEAVWLLKNTVFRNKTLVKLTLGIEIGEIVIGFPGKEPVFLPALKSLTIYGVWFRCESLYNGMLPGCPVLEELSLQYYSCRLLDEIKTAGTLLTVLPSFVNLVKLSVESDDTKERWQVLPSLLKYSPKLETLVLKGLYIGPSEVKVLEIYGFSRGSGGEFIRSKCFFRKMQIFQEMKAEIEADDNKILQLVSQILALPN
ncbi:unnamed protein product, partial [Thlaspi arvense]